MSKYECKKTPNDSYVYIYLSNAEEKKKENMFYVSRIFFFSCFFLFSFFFITKGSVEELEKDYIICDTIYVYK